MSVEVAHACGANPLLLWWLLLALLPVLLPIFCFAHVVGIVVGTIKSQGWSWTEVSVSVTGWPAVIDGAWPTERPPKSIPTDEKDEMAVGTPAAKNTMTHM